MNKAVLYVRVSSKEQEREGFSIPAQKKLLREYALENNLTIIANFEEAETAKKAGRIQFQKMVAFLKQNTDVKIVLVEKTDRLYRNFKDFTLLDVEQMGLQIHLVKEGEILSIDSKSHQKFIHAIKVLMAKNYSDNLSEEVKKGHKEKAEQGVWPSVAPIGYSNRLEDHSIIIDPMSAPLIRKGFELASTGLYSLAKIKRELYKNGLRSKRAGAELSKSAMARVLTNTFYFGDFIWKGKRFPGSHTPIIDKRLFDQVQEAMGFIQKPRLTKKDFNFTGVLTCGHCGCSITAEEKRKKSGRSYVYYHCTNGKGVCSNVIYIREEIIDDVFSLALKSIQLPKDVVDWTREALLESSKDEQVFRQAQIKNFTTRYQKLDSFISRSYDDKLEGTIEPDMWESKTNLWKQEQQEIEQSLQALRATNTSYLIDGIKLMELAAGASELFKSMTKDEKRETLSLVLSNPIIMNGSIEYDYKMPFSMFTNIRNLEKWRERRYVYRTINSGWNLPDSMEKIAGF